MINAASFHEKPADVRSDRRFERFEGSVACVDGRNMLLHEVAIRFDGALCISKRESVELFEHHLLGSTCAHGLATAAASTRRRDPPLGVDATPSRRRRDPARGVID